MKMRIEKKINPIIVTPTESKMRLNKSDTLIKPVLNIR